MESSGLSIYKICHLQTENFTFSFLVWMPFIYFSYMIYLARIFSTVESEYPCLAPDLRGKTFNFSLLGILAMKFSYMGFIMLRLFPLIIVCWEFFFFISWRLITLQYCSGFCHTLT